MWSSRLPFLTSFLLPTHSELVNEICVALIIQIIPNQGKITLRERFLEVKLCCFSSTIPCISAVNTKVFAGCVLTARIF